MIGTTGSNPALDDTSVADTISGHDDVTDLRPDGADTLSGGLGSDTLDGNADADTLVGEVEADDYASYASSGGGVIIDWSGGARRRRRRAK